ncbi:hypothetical protein EVAR_83312_1 [Eumeta japonica]|uniref:Uncharacterized protein n=1 Tax=Eumeta variegata TaxID=151549 RepID=A0A4C1VYA6_EUMVA|nr:hypothetical protein EVAR_83312_1 [Eumeta japonica]
MSSLSVQCLLGVRCHDFVMIASDQTEYVTVVLNKDGGCPFTKHRTTRPGSKFSIFQDLQTSMVFYQIAYIDELYTGVERGGTGMQIESETVIEIDTQSRDWDLKRDQKLESTKEPELNSKPDRNRNRSCRRGGPSGR